MYGYPNCCIDFHAENGPSSRKRAYEEFLQSGSDQSIPIEFWAVAHAPCSSTCRYTIDLGKKYLDAVCGFSEELYRHVKSRLLLPRFYQTGGGRFVDLQVLGDLDNREKTTISSEQFEEQALPHLDRTLQILLVKVPRPFVLVDSSDWSLRKTLFPNPRMIGTSWLAYSPAFGIYMMNARTGEEVLDMTNDNWLPKVGKEWGSESNFRIYRSRI
jgi:hypothetical protein